MATAICMRISSRSQTTAPQRREIERFLSGSDFADTRWYIDEGVSGSVMERPALLDLKRAIFMGEVDTFVGYALDRIARNAVEGMVLLVDWLERGVRLIVVTLQLDFNGEVGQMIASLLLHIAPIERPWLRERQAAGIAAAQAAGRKWGGLEPGTGLEADPKRVVELRRRGLTICEVAAALGISTRTVSRMVKRADSQKNHPEPAGSTPHEKTGTGS